ncbi:MAG: M15 family metallopeptidase [Clostridia bacterium]|nr:M15 family metallopeptidase [Clostridia bacterium]
MAKKYSKKQWMAKGILALLLLFILAGLAVGFAVTEKRKPAEPTTEALSEPETEPQTEPPTEGEVSAAPETTTAKVPPVSLPQSTDGNPVTVSPDGEHWELTLVNLQYRLPEDYKPTLKAAVEGSSVQLDERVAPFYAEMYAAAKADGCTLTPYSGYRTYARQQENFDRKVAYYVSQGLGETEAIAKTQTRILPAGASEHNMGFSMDIVSASADFISTKEFSWLTAHAHEYGFILRYPENKTDITGVMYEPWHWRFVGKEAAAEMQKSGQCLEEYLGIA